MRGRHESIVGKRFGKVIILEELNVECQQFPHFIYS